MQTLVDLAFGSLVAGVVLLLVLVLQFESSRNAIDATQFRTGKTGLLSFIEVVEQDFKNIGGQFREAPVVGEELALEDAISPGMPDTTGTTKAFEFRAQVDSTQRAALIRYEWTDSGETVELEDGTATLYDVERLVDGVVTGTFRGLVTRMEVHLRRYEDNAAPIFNPWDTRRVEVKIHAISPAGKGTLIEELRWEKHFHPVNMSRLDTACC